MAATTSTLSAIIKTFYVSDTINDQLNSSSILYQKLAKPAQLDVTGKSYTYAIRESRNRNAGKGIAEGGTFGTASNQGTRNITVPDCEITTSVEISGRLLRAATGAGKGAFVSALRLEVDGGMKDTVRAINRQLHSDGTDALAFWTAADDVSGTNVDDGQGNAFPIFLEPGATTCDLIDASDNSTVLGNDIVVTLGAEGASSAAITWTGSVSGSADGDYLVLNDTLTYQMMGIRGVISASDPALLSGGLHGLPVATYPYWKAQSYTNSGTNRDLTLELMQKPLTAVATRSAFSEADIAFLMGNGPVKDKYIALCVADKRHVNEMELDGGQTAVSFNNKPFIVDPQSRNNTIYYVNPKTMDLLTSSGGLVWADFEDGLQFKMKTGGSTASYADAYQAFLVFYGNLACKVRNGNAVLGDLNV